MPRKIRQSIWENISSVSVTTDADFKLISISKLNKSISGFIVFKKSNSW